MAKYCSQCGRALPEGVEKCPVCHAQEEPGSEAALFTQISAQTEVWKDPSQPEKKRAKIRRKPGTREKLLIYTGAVLLVALTAFVIIFTQPGTRIKRAIRSGDYEKAVSVYTEKYLDQGRTADDSIGRALEKKAQELCLAFENEELKENEVERQFDSLYSFDLNRQELDVSYAQYEKLKSTRSLISRAEGMIISEKYLEACDLLLEVTPDDANYESAQLRAQECLELYGQSVLARADELMAGDDYTAAIAALRGGNEALKEYDTFSSAIDGKLEECFKSYESHAVEEAENLAEIEEYGNAMNLIQTCIDSICDETETLTAALERYAELAQGKTSSDAVRKADEFYAQGLYADAFLELETAAGRVEETDELDSAAERLEKRFAADMLTKAEETLAGSRENIDAAQEMLDQAAAIRPLEELNEYREKLEALRPLSLVQAQYKQREGDVYRSASEFEATSGTKYADGWIWGGDGDYISYELGGAYDIFEGTLAIRRGNGASFSGYFEVWCDGELKYTSETLYPSSEAQGFSWEVSGCAELKIVFHCNYEVSTTENGYCYHGVCTPVLTKNME